MGATSVTGVGPGSAEALAKGPKERNFVGVEKLIGPRVVAVGKVEVDESNNVVVDFVNPLPCVSPLSAAALPPTPQNDYVVYLHNLTSPATVLVVTYVNSDSTGDVTVAANLKTHLKGFTATGGTNNQWAEWVLFKVGD